MNRQFFLITMVALLTFGCNFNKEQELNLGEFGAFYTKINSGEKWEEYSRTGLHADIVVDLGKEIGKIVFWRGSSYLPYFETANGKKIYMEEVVRRTGDGTDRMPDRTNTYSVVKIIENTSEKVVIHWRYLPEFKGGNPHAGVDGSKFCEELFTFTPEGSVTRIIKKGEEKIDDWKDKTNYTIHTFTITPEGFTKKQVKPAVKSYVPQAIEGNPIITRTIVEPKLWFKFDEAKGDITSETITGESIEIPGNKTQWRRGASGTAVQFDGHKNYVRLSAANAPHIQDAITLEGWVAMAAYPWSWTTIVQQMDDVPEKREFYVDGELSQLEILGGHEDEEEDDEEEYEDEEEVVEEKPERPWNERFEVKYLKEDDRGYFLGLNGYGQAGLKLRVAGVWEELTSERILKKDVLYHIIGTFDKESGKMKIYIDGKLDCEKQVAKAEIETSTKDVLVAKGKDRAQIAAVRHNTFPAPYTFDGIIDEVKVYDVALSADKIANAYSSFNIATEIMADMEVRKFPTGERTGEFGSRYTFLKFYDSWENLWRTGAYSDVVVEFEDNPSKFIFWRGMSFIEMMGNELDQFYSNEFNETWSTSGGNGCQEPMSDKGSYYDYAKIIENTPARTVVEWRFALKDVNYVMANYVEETGWCDWSSWYYYIYPDGVAVKMQQLWSTAEGEEENDDGGLNHEWQESMAIFGPNQHPHDVVSREKTLTYVGLDGDYVQFDWEERPPTEDQMETAFGKNIQVINFTGEYDPVTIVEENHYYSVYGGELTDYAVFCTWNHWPVAQMPSDGRYALFPDRTGHSSLTHIGYPFYEQVSNKESKAPYQKKIMMQGMLNENPEQLAKLARSWLSAPKINIVTGGTGTYDRSQRAYVIESDGQQLVFNFDCSNDSPLVNVALVIKNWGDKTDAKVKVDDIITNCRQGVFRDTDGNYTKVIWIPKVSSNPISFEVLHN